MSKKDLSRADTVIVARLSIERCQCYLSHLNTLMFMCENDLQERDSVRESMESVIETIHKELLQSYDFLALEA